MVSLEKVKSEVLVGVLILWLFKIRHFDEENNSGKQEDKKKIAKELNKIRSNFQIVIP